MKKRFIIINLFMSVVILFAILFQSVDSYEHLVKKLAEKQCHHKIDDSNQITHQHVGFEKCFVCEFSFSTYLKKDLQVFISSSNVNFCVSNSFYFKESNSFYNGISYSLRGPPIV